MTSPLPTILIIIVTWNKKQYVLDLLASVSYLHYPTELLSIVVVDNASEDGTVEAIAAAYPNVQILENSENLGGTGGFNTGLQWAFAQPESHCQYLWLLDNDVVVHEKALWELVNILEQHPDIAVAGSTMMQLDYPWRINEMGAFVNLGLGKLVLNRHQENIYAWQGQPLAQLLKQPIDLTQLLIHCQTYMDVDYVAAASLLIRAPIARQAGLWRDYFIHFDDVEWCLRIRDLGYRVVAVANSLIWHLSAAAKVPTWILYYDNRNLLDLLAIHRVPLPTLNRLIRHIYLKAGYYCLLGKTDLAQLHYQAVHDFLIGRWGRQPLQLDHQYQKPASLLTLLLNSKVKRILIAWTLHLQAMQLQTPLVQAKLQRPDLKIHFLTLPGGLPIFQFPQAHFISLPKNALLRWWTYWKLRGDYDLVIQSDYQASIGLAWLKSDLIYANDEGFCHRSPPTWQQVVKAGWIYWKSLFQSPYATK